MDTTIRNLDPAVYRALKARAALQGRTIGDVLNEAMQIYLSRPEGRGRQSLADLEPDDYGAGYESLSNEVDATVYGG